MMQTRILCNLSLMAGLTAPLALSEPPATPKPRTSTQRVVLARGASYLGVGVVEISPERAKELHLKDEHGVEVRCVDPESPALKAGLKEGDVVLEYNGQRVEGGEQFMRLVRETPPGRSAALLIFRGGATQTVTASIGQRRPGPMEFEFDDNSFAFAVPSIPSTPPMAAMPPIRIPDIPRTLMSWRSGTLGIESETLNPQLAEYFGVKEGVLVRSVTRDSSAEKAGFKAGDVIVKVDGQKVTTPKEISSVIQSSRSKKNLPIAVIRHQKEITLTVVLEESSRWPAEGLGEML
jgi:serine protease Do